MITLQDAQERARASTHTHKQARVSRAVRHGEYVREPVTAMYYLTKLQSHVPDRRLKPEYWVRQPCPIHRHLYYTVRDCIYNNNNK